MSTSTDISALNENTSLLESRKQTIGEIFLQGGQPLLKMWNVTVLNGMRRQVKHSHSRFEINLVTDGSGEYSTEKRAYPIKAGDLYIFSSNEEHCITKVTSPELSITVLHFEPRYLIDGGPEPANTDFINFCFSHSSSFENRIRGETAAALKQNFKAVMTELTMRENSYNTAIRAYLELMLIDLLRNYNYKAPQSDINRKSVFNMLKVYNYIDEHLSEELTLDTLSRVAGLSPNYFSHSFKQLNDISLWDYITAKRIEKAIRLITSPDTGLTMLEIALRSGFNNTVNFNKAFKRNTGITPSELKKNPKILLH